jgi:hypothetical protein
MYPVSINNRYLVSTSVDSTYEFDIFKLYSILKLDLESYKDNSTIIIAREI